MAENDTHSLYNGIEISKLKNRHVLYVGFTNFVWTERYECKWTLSNI